MAKPTTVMNWANSPTTLRTEPPSGLKNTGFSVNHRLPAQYFNWLIGNLCEWANWLYRWFFDPCLLVIRETITCHYAGTAAPGDAALPLGFNVTDTDNGWTDFPGTYDATGKSVTANDSTDEFTCASHGYVTGDMVYLTTTGSAPSPINASDANNRYCYFVLRLTDNTFSLTEYPGGTAIDLATAGTGCKTHKVTTSFEVPSAGIYEVDLSYVAHIPGASNTYVATSIYVDGSEAVRAYGIRPDASSIDHDAMAQVRMVAAFTAGQLIAFKACTYDAGGVSAGEFNTRGAYACIRKVHEHVEL